MKLLLLKSGNNIKLVSCTHVWYYSKAEAYFILAEHKIFSIFSADLIFFVTFLYQDKKVNKD